MIKRRISRPINVGGVKVGGGARVVIQSMTKTDTRDVSATLNQINRLAECGCGIVRLAVPDMDAADSLGRIKKSSPIPLIADIHFDHRLAVASINSGVDQVRFNPGNIRGDEKIAEIVRCASERSLPLRIGVNAGSLAHKRDEAELATLMAEAALDQVRLLEDMNYDLIEISLKASDVMTTIEANKLIALKTPYPLHIGITEAGLPGPGSIRSAVGLGVLLYEGLGDSLRVSLTTPDPCEEVLAGLDILHSLELMDSTPRLISCPTCGRCEAEGFFELAGAIEKELRKLEKPVTVAVMGCVVNGPGEARDADVGLACGRGRGVIFKKGEKVATVEETEFFSALMKEISVL
ncbi:MAG: flavodoxin-dependent (E)-4-hydroxy-3-methylbut-2-enyl-diphosphate synthase [Dehalococcoidia bacterium]